MEPTTVTTIFMIMFAIGVISSPSTAGSATGMRQSELSRLNSGRVEIETAVLELRRAIRDCERSDL